MKTTPTPDRSPDRRAARGPAPTTRGPRPAAVAVGAVTALLAVAPIALADVGPGGATAATGATQAQVETTPVVPPAPAAPLRVAKLRIYVSGERRGAKLFVRVSGGTTTRERGRIVLIDGRVGAREARICQTTVNRFGSINALCRVDALIRGRAGLVKVTATLPATADAAEVSAVKERGLARPLNARLIEGVGIRGLVKIGDRRTVFIRRVGKPSWFTGLVSLGFRGGRLQGFLLFDRTVKTARGIGIGSTRAATQRAYPTSRCVTGPDGRPICFLSSSRGGKRAEMYFRFGRGGKVSEISVHRPGAYGFLPGAPQG